MGHFCNIGGERRDVFLMCLNIIALLLRETVALSATVVVNVQRCLRSAMRQHRKAVSRPYSQAKKVPELARKHIFSTLGILFSNIQRTLNSLTSLSLFEKRV